eukprot:5117357-Amphidinium_carterae.1
MGLSSGKLGRKDFYCLHEDPPVTRTHSKVQHVDITSILKVRGTLAASLRIAVKIFVRGALCQGGFVMEPTRD